MELKHGIFRKQLHECLDFGQNSFFASSHSSSQMGFMVSAIRIKNDVISLAGVNL